MDRHNRLKLYYNYKFLHIFYFYNYSSVLIALSMKPLCQSQRRRATHVKLASCE